MLKKIFTAAVLFFVFCSFAFGQTSEELQKQIEALLKQLEALQEQLAGLNPVETPAFEVQPGISYVVILEGSVQDIFGISFKILSYPAKIQILREGNIFQNNDYIFFSHKWEDPALGEVGAGLALVKKGPAKGENLAAGESKTIAIFSVSEKTAVVFVEVEAVNSRNEQITVSLKAVPATVASVKSRGKLPAIWGAIKGRK